MRLRTKAVGATMLALLGLLAAVHVWATSPLPPPRLEAPLRQARAPALARPPLPPERRVAPEVPASHGALPAPTAPAPAPPPPFAEPMAAAAPAPEADPELQRVPLDTGEARAEHIDLRTGEGLEATQLLGVQPMGGGAGLDTGVRPVPPEDALPAVEPAGAPEVEATPEDVGGAEPALTQQP